MRKPSDDGSPETDLTPQLLRTAVALDARFAALSLGLVDAAVMALAQRHQLPVLTYDFEDFRAAPPSSGFWQLVIDESRYHEAIGLKSQE